MSRMLGTMLVDALNAHGVPCRLEEERVVVHDGVLTFHMRTTSKSTRGDHVLLQLDVGAEAPQLRDRMIWTSFAGFGADEKAATAHGFARFLLGPFHVLLAALAGHVCDGGSEEWRTLNGRIEWEVCDSPLVTLGIPDASAVPIKPVIEGLMTSFVSVADPDVHWGDVFFAFLNRERNAFYVTLDGEPWPEGTELLANWNWAPAGDGYAAGRYFFLARPPRLIVK